MEKRFLEVGFFCYLSLIAFVLILMNFVILPVSAAPGTVTPMGASSISVADSDNTYWWYPGSYMYFEFTNGFQAEACSLDGGYCSSWISRINGNGSAGFSIPASNAYGAITHVRQQGATYPNNFIYWFKVSTSATNGRTTGFTYSPESGTQFYPALVNFTDTSVGATSWDWNFGDGTEHATAQNPSHTFTTAGTFNVTLTVSGGSSVSHNYVVNEYNAPVCGYTASVLQGSSPITITFTDTSSNNPTGYIWNFNPLDMGYLTVSPSSYNTTQNPTVTISGSGVIPIFHQVSNPGGSSICSYQYLNLSGMAPTPTPTSNVPFPNSSGVCQNSAVSVGSGTTSELYRTAYLSKPDGSSILFSITAGDVAIFSGIDYTALLGLYVYNQYTQPDGTLEYRQSYVVENCLVPTPTGTYTPTVTPTIPTVIYTPYPTTTTVYPTVSYTIYPTSTLPSGGSWVNLSPMPSTLPVLPDFANSSHWRDQICAAPYIGLSICPFIDSFTLILGWLNGMITFLLSVITSPIMFIITVWNYSSALTQSILAGWLTVCGVFISVIGQVVGALPDKVKGVVTLIMALDLLKQCTIVTTKVK